MFNFDIILVSWNRLDYLKRTIASLISSGAIQDCQRFIIVDNGSTEEGVQDFLRSLIHDYRAFLVLLPENRGWGTAVNEALGLSRAPYLLVSNNDVEYKQDFHRHMWEIFENQSNTPVPCGPGQRLPRVGILGVWRHTSHSETGNGVKNQWFVEMDDVPAVGWMMPKAVMQIVGMLPERGPCFTKGGNGEDSEYVNLMKKEGFLVGVPAMAIEQDTLASHIDGY